MRLEKLFCMTSKRLFHNLNFPQKFATGKNEYFAPGIDLGSIQGGLIFDLYPKIKDWKSFPSVSKGGVLIGCLQAFLRYLLILLMIIIYV